MIIWPRSGPQVSGVSLLAAPRSVAFRTNGDTLVSANETGRP